MNLLLTQGNSLKIPLADESVHCVVTSPPYWGLRDYGIGDQLGLEPTPEEYVENMVAVFREVRRVLRDDGVVFLNLGDSYWGGKGQSSQAWSTAHQDRDTLQKAQHQITGMGETRPQDGNHSILKPKDLCGIPWRVAFALQADGWWLRSDIIWSKPNPMPESVTDRPTKAHEYLFLLTKSARYYYDADAVREEIKPESQQRASYGYKETPRDKLGHSHHGKGYQRNDGTPVLLNPSGRNRRTVWHIATAPYSGAHFATYPPALVEPCIKAGTSERGVCPECGSPWERVVEKDTDYLEGLGNMGAKGSKWMEEDKQSSGFRIQKNMNALRAAGRDHDNPFPKKNTLGWRPTCEHYEEGIVEGTELTGMFGDPIPAVVFDPFAGSGTTLQVARALGRNGVGLDLSLDYLHLARERLSLDALDAWGKGKKDGAVVTDLPMFEGLA